jgi:hypothetical protein
VFISFQVSPCSVRRSQEEPRFGPQAEKGVWSGTVATPAAPIDEPRNMGGGRGALHSVLSLLPVFHCLLVGGRRVVWRKWCGLGGKETGDVRGCQGRPGPAAGGGGPVAHGFRGGPTAHRSGGGGPTTCGYGGGPWLSASSSEHRAVGGGGSRTVVSW